MAGSCLRLNTKVLWRYIVILNCYTLLSLELKREIVLNWSYVWAL